MKNKNIFPIIAIVFFILYVLSFTASDVLYMLGYRGVYGIAQLLIDFTFAVVLNAYILIYLALHLFNKKANYLILNILLIIELSILLIFRIGSTLKNIVLILVKHFPLQVFSLQSIINLLLSIFFIILIIVVIGKLTNKKFPNMVFLIIALIILLTTTILTLPSMIPNIHIRTYLYISNIISSISTIFYYLFLASFTLLLCLDEKNK